MGFLSKLTKPLDMVFGDNKPPPAPDFVGLEEKKSASDLELARQQTEANRPNQYSPYGSVEWSQPDSTNPDRWRQDIRFTPEQQQIFNAQQRMQQGQAISGARAVDQAGNIFSSPFEVPGQAPRLDWAPGAVQDYRGPQGEMPQYSGPEGEMPEYGAHRQRVMDAMLSRVRTDVGRDRDAKRSQLIAQGIPVGSEAYNRQMEMLDRKETDARQQAELSAEQMAGMGYASGLAGRELTGRERLTDFTTGMAGRELSGDEAMDRFSTGLQARDQRLGERMTKFGADERTHQQQLQDALLGRNQPINEMNAWQTGSQIGLPQFQGYNQQQFVGGPDYSNAGLASSQYNLGSWNADTASNNALMSGLFGLGAAGIGLL